MGNDQPARDQPAAGPSAAVKQPRLRPCREVAWTLHDELGERVAAAIEQWILPLPHANPAILEMFRERDLQPPNDRCPWEGEYAGKYLTHCVQIYRLTRSAKLRTHLQWFVDQLRSVQAADGYLGPWPPGSRLTGNAPNSVLKKDGTVRLLPTWDAWGHYHIMLGLLLWYRETADAGALDCVRRIADLLCATYLDGTRLYATSPGCEEMNMACLHGLSLLYPHAPKPEYRQLMRQIETDLEQPQCGDYIRVALAGKEFYEGRKPRWESLHVIQGIVELYYLTGDDRHRRAFEQIWWSIARSDRHNNGGFSSGEMAAGNPYDNGPIETCCTIAWMALSIDMLKLTGNPIVADEIELSLLNSGLGFLSRSGRWCTYNTPMEGTRGAFVIDHNWQAKPGAPELNCCAVNAPRSLGMIGEWGVMEAAGGLAINYYGPGAVQTRTPAGHPIRLTQKTDYPASGRIALALELDEPEKFTLQLRVPQWSGTTGLALNGTPLPGPRPGAYADITREWRSGDRITLDLDLSLHYWVGEHDYAGRSSIYRGPILLAYDPRLNGAGNAGGPGDAGDAENEGNATDARDSADAGVSVDVGDSANAGDSAGAGGAAGAADAGATGATGAAGRPQLDAAHMPETTAPFDGWLTPWLQFQYPTRAGGQVTLCDFASAGATGNHYLTWFEVANLEPTPFSPTNTVRSSRSGEPSAGSRQLELPL